MERQPLSIRKFAEVCGVSHTEIGRNWKGLLAELRPEQPAEMGQPRVVQLSLL